jgi:RNA polymerase sigma-32 factor
MAVMATNNTLPVLVDGGLAHYMQQVNSFPMLTHEEETDLANRWVQNQDIEAAHALVTSHLRLVVKMAHGFRGYGLPVTDLISEGNVGLMQAVKRFDPDKGFRLSTYAMWWIKASMHEYILRSWSMVKMGSSAAQKKLFFNLRKMKNKIIGATDRHLLPDEITEIATNLDVPESDVMEMEQRMGGRDLSLNTPVSRDGDSGDWLDFMADGRKNQEIILLESEEKIHQREMLQQAMETLNEREKDIVTKRRLHEPAVTLEDLSQEYSISRERVRQIENRAMEKLTEAVLAAA